MASACRQRLRALVRSTVRAEPARFDPMLGLRAIGYDTRQPEAAIAAFRMHHTPETRSDEPIERDGALIHCLAEKSLEQ
jgi:hypothetical protein